MTRLFSLIIIVPAFLFALFLPTHTVEALSSGCISWNTANGFATPGISGNGLSFAQNETLSVNATGTFDVTGASTATGVTSFSYTFPSAGIYSFTFQSNPNAVLTWTIHCGPIPTSSAGNNVTFWNFTDGRINSHDGAQTAAVYCEESGITVYAVINSVGHLAFKVTKAQLDAVPTKPPHNTLIKSRLGVSLYRLTTGELQINAPNNDAFTWDDCSAA